MSVPNPDTSTYAKVHKQILDWLPTRKTLIDRLKDHGDHSSWNEFFSTYSKLIYNFARRTGLTQVEAQEVVQETVIAFSKKSAEYRYDPEQGSFKSWLLQLTRWRITDQLRKRTNYSPLNSAMSLDENRVGRDESKEPALSTGNMHAAWEEEWRSHLLALAMERVRKTADPRHYQAFELYVVRNMSAAKVQARLGINRGLLYVYKHRISRLIKKEFQQLESDL